MQMDMKTQKKKQLSNFHKWPMSAFTKSVMTSSHKNEEPPLDYHKALHIHLFIFIFKLWQVYKVIQTSESLRP